MRSDTATTEELDAFDELIDVRSPTEFALDHIPGAINCPVLDDAERARVGTIYKQESPFLAKKIGAALVARNVAMHLESKFTDRPRHWRPLVYCWRGGKRSESMTTVLRAVGWDARQLDGGYKAYRRNVLSDIDAAADRLTFVAVCGLTGSGKSRLLTALTARGAQVLDLEQLAMHRGSVLGKVPNASQPSQKRFESLVWQALRQFNASQPVFVESESKKIGDIHVPDSLIARMWASECLRVDAETETRVRLLIDEYSHFIINGEALREPLQALTPLHGKQRVAEWLTLIDQGAFEPLVSQLLEQHYDPAYLRSIGAHYARFHCARTARINGIESAHFDQVAEQVLTEMRAAA